MAGPLVWGRVAALIMRATASMYNPGELNLQCYVDDPLLAVRGNKRERVSHLGVALLLLCSLNFKLSWNKGAGGSQVDWIGASIGFLPASSSVNPWGVFVTINADKVKELHDSISDINIKELWRRRASTRRLRRRSWWI